MDRLFKIDVLHRVNTARRSEKKLFGECQDCPREYYFFNVAIDLASEKRFYSTFNIVERVMGKTLPPLAMQSFKFIYRKT